MASEMPEALVMGVGLYAFSIGAVVLACSFTYVALYVAAYRIVPVRSQRPLWQNLSRGGGGGVAPLIDLLGSIGVCAVRGLLAADESGCFLRVL